VDTNDLPEAARNAIDELIPERITGDAKADLVAAAREVWDRRNTNTALGWAVLKVLHEVFGCSWRQITALTSIPWATARGWGRPPRTAASRR
jgi:hypothetical protein